MKIAVLSDVHGNLPALQAVLADLQDFHPDHLLFAGDFTRGPFPNEVIHLLRQHNAHMILGNDDLRPLRYIKGEAPQQWRTSQQFAMLRWTAHHLTSENVHFLTTLPHQRILTLPGPGAIQLVHGSPRSPSESLTPNDLLTLDRSLAAVTAPLLICGHTHIQWAFRRNAIQVINPGAVAGTLIGPYAQYARLTWGDEQWQVDLRTIAYPFAPLQHAFENSGLLAEGGPLARGFLLSQQTGHDFMMAFLRYAAAYARQNGWQGGPALPDDLWFRAADSFSWDLPGETDHPTP
jgi:putative phosphoesterase